MGQAGACPGPDAGHPLQAAGGRMALRRFRDGFDNYGNPDLMPVSLFKHQPERCPFGHQLGPGRIQIGWSPCVCTAAREAAGRGRGLGHLRLHCLGCGCRGPGGGVSTSGRTTPWNGTSGESAARRDWPALIQASAPAAAAGRRGAATFLSQTRPDGTGRAEAAVIRDGCPGCGNAACWTQPDTPGHA